MQILFLHFQVGKVSSALKTDKDVGKLLYHVATKLKTKKFLSPIVEYIASKKITSEIQLNGKMLSVC